MAVFFRIYCNPCRMVFLVGMESTSPTFLFLVQNRQYMEQTLATRPDMVDTDDDGNTDGTEWLNGWNATYSVAPAVSRSLRLGGAPGDYVAVPISSVAGPPGWTLEAWVNPTNVVSLGEGTVVRLLTSGATIRGLTLVNSGSNHDKLDAGVQVRGHGNRIEDNIIDDCLFGIDLQQSNDNVVAGNRIRSKRTDLNPQTKQ